MMTTFSDGLVALCAGLLVIAALHDVATRTIPNTVSLLLLLTAITLRLIIGGVLTGLGCGLIVFVCLTLLWLRGFIGGGDIKLAAAAAVAIPTATLAPFILATAVAGGAISLIYLALSLAIRRPPPGRPQRLLARLCKAEAWRISHRGSIPYGAAIAAGGLTVFIPGLLTTLSR